MARLLGEEQERRERKDNTSFRLPFDILYEEAEARLSGLAGRYQSLKPLAGRAWEAVLPEHQAPLTEDLSDLRFDFSQGPNTRRGLVVDLPASAEIYACRFYVDNPERPAEVWQPLMGYSQGEYFPVVEVSDAEREDVDKLIHESGWREHQGLIWYSNARDGLEPHERDQLDALDIRYANNFAFRTPTSLRELFIRPKPPGFRV